MNAVLSMEIAQRATLAAKACGLLLQRLTKRYSYPWTELETDLLKSNSTRFHLVGYGSLLNPDSARYTIRDTPRHGHPPMIAFGCRRLLNYIMPDSLFRHSGFEPPRIERAAFNVVWTGNPSDILNGRVLDIPISDLPALREREKGYHLDPVAFVPWDQPTAEPAAAFVLSADHTPWNGIVYLDSNILPNQGYVQLCRDGAKMVGEEFERALLTTSWLADGETRLDSYLSKTGLSDQRLR